MSLRIHAVGDVAPRRPDVGSLFVEVGEILRSGDICFGQMECPISDRGSPSPNAKLPMRTYPSVAPALREVGFDVMSIAGNHSMDFGETAFADTVAHLHAAGIEACGGGHDLAAARVPAIIERKGLRVAFLAYCSILPSGYAADVRRPGCAPMRAYTHYHHVESDQPGTPPRVLTFPYPDDLDRLLDDVATARMNADVVIVSFHWGLHFIRAQLADYQRTVARAVIDAGAHAIIGHHPHLLKAVEIYCGRPIFYSLGNFAIEQPRAFDENIHLHSSFDELRKLSGGWRATEQYMAPPETRHTMIVELEVDGAGVVTPTLQLCRIDDDCVPHVLQNPQDEFREACAYLRDITAEAGIDTQFVADGDRIRVTAPDSSASDPPQQAAP